MSTCAMDYALSVYLSEQRECFCITEERCQENGCQDECACECICDDILESQEYDRGEYLNSLDEEREWEETQ